MLLYTVELRAAPDDALHHPWSDLPGFYRYIFLLVLHAFCGWHLSLGLGSLNP